LIISTKLSVRVKIWSITPDSFFEVLDWDFRETATKTNSLIDRLRKLTLPAVADVRDGLESYRETKERAEDLDAKIRRTDDLIDEIRENRPVDPDEYSGVLLASETMAPRDLRSAVERVERVYPGLDNVVEYLSD